jgi:hypothetical protein
MMIAFTTVSAELAGQHIGRYVRFTHGDGWDDWVIQGWLHKVSIPENSRDYVYLSTSDNEVEDDIDGIGGYGFWPGDVVILEFPDPPRPAATGDHA